MSPRRTYRWAVRVMLATAPLSVLTLLAWGFRWIPDTRPTMVLMVYLLELLVCVGAGAVAALSACHLAISKAFMAGYKTGAASVWPDDDETRPNGGGMDPLLRLVE